MDLVVLIFIGLALLFFWGVWIFGYWLPMAKESQRQFAAQQARERAEQEAVRRKNRDQPDGSSGPAAAGG